MFDSISNDYKVIKLTIDNADDDLDDDPELTNVPTAELKVCV